MPSSGTNLTRPLTTCRGFSSPTSISSQYSASALGWRHTLTMVPTRMSAIATDTSASCFFEEGLSLAALSAGGRFSGSGAPAAELLSGLPFGGHSALAAALAAPSEGFASAPVCGRFSGFGAAAAVEELPLDLLCGACAGSKIGALFSHGFCTETRPKMEAAAVVLWTRSYQRSRLQSWSVCALGSDATAPLTQLKTKRSARLRWEVATNVRSTRCLFS
mmetsp:Transcript_31525/g.74933  ORF Transcript_31525/g.74933 Transcript_31525/m.74933 type:complete len:219 (+) Transcript_31525:418-1074(+)